MSGFEALGLSPSLVRIAAGLGYAQPTPIQAAAIPAVLAGRDVLASADTGSGKTAAFVLPVLQRLDPPMRGAPRSTQALVLVPTRELAAQVGDVASLLARGLPDAAKVVVLHGGVSINPQMMALRGGAEVVVATPGRLLDVVAQNALRLSHLRCLVLDEADRLLDAGFADELKRVLALLPRRRQSLMFSATFPPAVQALADGMLHDPLRVEVLHDPLYGHGLHDPQHVQMPQDPLRGTVPHEPATSPAIEQHAVEVNKARRTPLLRHLIEQGAWTRVLVFVATRYACEHVADKLQRAGVAAAAFHGDASQGARSQVLAAFKAGTLQVLVATDLGARGLDIARLPVVVNYDLPRSAVDYVHRIGRTGRAGEQGLAVSFISPDTEAHFRLIEKRQGQRVARERIAGFEPTQPAAPPPAKEGGVKGRRPSKKDKLRAAASHQDS